MLPPEIASLLNKHGYALKQAEQLLNRLPQAAPESLLHALKDLLEELYGKGQDKSKALSTTPEEASNEHPEQESPAYLAFISAYNAIMGELDQHSLFEDPDLWAELYPIILRRLKFALSCLAGHPKLDEYPEVFQEYCRAGGRGSLSYEQACAAFAQMMHTPQEQLPDDDETMIALKQLQNLRESASALFAQCPQNHEQYDRAKDCFNRLMEVLAFESLLAFPRYGDAIEDEEYIPF